jgi:glutamyl-tRNA synthetase
MTLAPTLDAILRENGIEQPLERIAQVIGMMKMKKINFIKELWPLCDFFFIAPQTFNLEDKFVKKNWKENSKAEMQQLYNVLEGVEDFNIEPMREAVDKWVEESGAKPWNAWRVALVGEGKGPDMHELSAFLGKKETLERLAKAIEVLP